MKKTYRFLEIALISLTLAACVILYTVGLDHADLGLRHLQDLGQH